MNSMEEINLRIESEYCSDTTEQLTDEQLLEDFKTQPSVITKINRHTAVYRKYNINEHDIECIIKELMPDLVPPGTKGSIRGNKFNHIVKDYIENMMLDPNQYDICFEKKHISYITDEKPDFYILHKETNRIIIGMNQVDLWNGGQQINRGYKYICDNKMNTDNCKFLCVVCNKTWFRSIKNKSYELFRIGFRNNTLCYLKNLENIIKSFFQI
jgi:hypothetical protein